jgi:hypothetical protein
MYVIFKITIKQYIVLYARVICSVALREEYKLRVFVYTLRKRIFAFIHEGRWVEELHKEQTHNLYSSLNIIRMVMSKMTRLGGVCRIRRISFIHQWLTVLCWALASSSVS